MRLFIGVIAGNVSRHASDYRTWLCELRPRLPGDPDFDELGMLIKKDLLKIRRFGGHSVANPLIRY